MKTLKKIGSSIKNAVVSTVVASKKAAFALVGAVGLSVSGAFNNTAYAAMTFDPAAQIVSTQTQYEGYADTIMTFLWTAGPIIMLGFVAWGLLKRGVKSAK